MIDTSSKLNVLQSELDRAKEELASRTIFVQWLESMISVEKIRLKSKEVKHDERISKNTKDNIR